MHIIWPLSKYYFGSAIIQINDFKRSILHESTSALKSIPTIIDSTKVNFEKKQQQTLNTIQNQTTL